MAATRFHSEGRKPAGSPRPRGRGGRQITMPCPQANADGNQKIQRIHSAGMSWYMVIVAMKGKVVPIITIRIRRFLRNRNRKCTRSFLRSLWMDKKQWNHAGFLATDTASKIFIWTIKPIRGRNHWVFTFYGDLLKELPLPILRWLHLQQKTTTSIEG